MSDEHDFSLLGWCSKCGCFKIRAEYQPSCSEQQKINQTHTWSKRTWRDEVWWVCEKCGVDGGDPVIVGMPPMTKKNLRTSHNGKSVKIITPKT